MTDTSITSSTTLLPGAAILMRLRRLIVVGILAAIANWFLISGSKGGCFAGESTDSAGDTAPAEAMCTTLTLRANGIMPVALAIVVIWVIGRVIRAAADEADAIRMIDRTSAVIAIVAAAGIVISYVWFALTPLPDPSSSYSVFSPFPFASIGVDISPATP